MSLSDKRKELKNRLLPHAKRSLAQKQRWINHKWAKGKISRYEMVKQEDKLYQGIQDKIDKLCGKDLI